MYTPSLELDMPLDDVPVDMEAPPQHQELPLWQLVSVACQYVETNPADALRHGHLASDLMPEIMTEPQIIEALIQYRQQFCHHALRQLANSTSPCASSARSFIRAHPKRMPILNGVHPEGD